MKANELRIGNIIGWRLGTGQLVVGRVHAIESDKIAISEKRETISEDGEPATGQGFMLLKGIEPIPINEEWLLKFGVWERMEDGNGGLILVSDGWPITVEPPKENGRHFSVSVNDEYEIAAIEYVNQLQNLYFALVGNELELK